MKRLSKLIKVIIAVAVLIISALVTLGLYNHYNSVKVDWSKTKDVFDVISNGGTILAVLIGAIWAYFNFFKGRTYRSRLEPKVSGKLIYRDDAYFLIVTAQLKNVGLSDVRITQDGTALRVFAYVSGERTSKARSVRQTRLITLSVFKNHGWIEPGELIDDHRLIAIPDVEYVALQLSLRIVSHKIEWNSAAIIEPPPLIDGSTSTQFNYELSSPPFQEGYCVTAQNEKDDIGDSVATTRDLANITMEKAEDALESKKIEEEKAVEEIIKVESLVPTEEQRQMQGEAFMQYETGSYGETENEEIVGVGSPATDQADEDPTTTKTIEEEKEQESIGD